ncbi:hypothetical protein TEA_004080 [Camellia sinensis var. sinensis]|uniref:Homeobox domain-containing protein n=1 Tax=Camellia sinensis var. sinensis TaxID=542762 RepID=A0A4S4EVD4_CAMSN|nr:hypothetical protein TEA_004080 [Camellia sinensis var. sinensis]
MEAVMACWEIEQSLQSLTGVSPGEGTGATMSDDDDDQVDSDTNLFDGSLEGADILGFGPLVPTESERSLMERVRQELKHELKQGYKEKIVDIREEILRKRRAGKLPGDTTSMLKAWWQSHSKWPYPTEEDKARLVQETGLQLKQINNWFINQRKRNWHSNSSTSTVLKSKRKRYANSSTCNFIILYLSRAFANLSLKQSNAGDNSGDRFIAEKGNLGVPQLPGQGCSFHSFRTNTYKLSFMESPSAHVTINWANTSKAMILPTSSSTLSTHTTTTDAVIWPTPTMPPVTTAADAVAQVPANSPPTQPPPPPTSTANTPALVDLTHLAANTASCRMPQHLFFFRRSRERAVVSVEISAFSVEHSRYVGELRCQLIHFKRPVLQSPDKIAEHMGRWQVAWLRFKGNRPGFAALREQLSENEEVFSLFCFAQPQP